jgi:hypothetical protein
MQSLLCGGLHAGVRLRGAGGRKALPYSTLGS